MMDKQMNRRDHAREEDEEDGNWRTLGEAATRVVQRIGLSPDETATACAVSRTRVFEAIRNGELTARKAGRTTIIEFEEAQRWVRSMPTRKPRR
jgi:hypothetical protein